jgi:hypothetical protein
VHDTGAAHSDLLTFGNVEALQRRRNGFLVLCPAHSVVQSSNQEMHMHEYLGSGELTTVGLPVVDQRKDEPDPSCLAL